MFGLGGFGNMLIEAPFTIMRVGTENVSLVSIANNPRDIINHWQSKEVYPRSLLVLVE